MMNLKTLVLVVSLLCTAQYVSGQSSKSDNNLGVTKSYVLKKINNIRTNGCKCGRKYYKPVAPLKWNEVLEYSAYLHAKDMHQNKFFAHHSSDGEDIGERLDDLDYKWHHVGENLAEGQDSFKEALKDWLESKSHCEMIMNKDMKEMGLYRFGKYWVNHFGTPMPKGSRRVSSTYREG